MTSLRGRAGSEGAGRGGPVLRWLGGGRRVRSGVCPSVWSNGRRRGSVCLSWGRGFVCPEGRGGGRLSVCPEGEGGGSVRPEGQGRDLSFCLSVLGWTKCVCVGRAVCLFVRPRGGVEGSVCPVRGPRRGSVRPGGGLSVRLSVSQATRGLLSVPGQRGGLSVCLGVGEIGLCGRGNEGVCLSVCLSGGDSEGGVACRGDGRRRSVCLSEGQHGGGLSVHLSLVAGVGAPQPPHPAPLPQHQPPCMRPPRDELQGQAGAAHPP